MVPTAERITTKIKRTTPVWMEAIVRHVLWASARKSKDIILPHSPSLKCKFRARYTISCKQQILGYLADRIAMVSEAVWAKSRIPTQSGGDFTHQHGPCEGLKDRLRLQPYSNRFPDLVCGKLRSEEHTS